MPTESDNCKWTDNAIKALIHLYEEKIDHFNNSTTRSSTIWRQISEELTIQNLKYSHLPLLSHLLEWHRYGACQLSVNMQKYLLIPIKT